MKPLVSIIIPAHNAEEWIADAVLSAIEQSWPRKEIIVVDDGSSDRTREVAKRFASKHTAVVSIPNQGAAAARNHGFDLCQGDYIQWLDADDKLAADKIEVQLRDNADKRVLLSSSWAPFYYRTRRSRFIANALCQDLSPVEWLLRKMGGNLHMQTATWLTSRELAEAAGRWDERLSFDDDGEYFCRVLISSEGTHYVSKTGVYYRILGVNRLTYIGSSDQKKESLLSSMKLHMQYLRSLEESDRVRNACLRYMQTWYHIFYPARPDLAAELRSLAARLHGRLEPPKFGWKYDFIKGIFGSNAAQWGQNAVAQGKLSCRRYYDRAIQRIEAAADRSGRQYFRGALK